MLKATLNKRLRKLSLEAERYDIPTIGPPSDQQEVQSSELLVDMTIAMKDPSSQPLIIKVAESSEEL